MSLMQASFDFKWVVEDQNMHEHPDSKLRSEMMLKQMKDIQENNDGFRT